MEAVTLYSPEFYEEEAKVAQESALIVAPWVKEHIDLDYFGRIIDIGCGTGEWAYAFADYENTVLGIDLYAPRTVPIPRLSIDISQGINCTGWDLAICLEVAEHLPSESAEPLVAGLAQAGTVLFSAATPGQPGVGHINCQPHDYWHGLFAAHGMVPEFIGDKFTEPVADFYRRNMFLYRRP